MQRFGLALWSACFLFLLALCGGVWLARGPEHAMAPHPDHASVLRAVGDTSALLPWGLAVGLTIFALMAVATLLGIRRGGRFGRLGAILLAGYAGVAGIFALVVHTGPGGGGASTELFGGFPVATAWMIYGVWWAPTILLAAMAFAFRSFSFTEADEERFQILVAAQRSTAAHVPADDGPAGEMTESTEGRTDG